MENKNYVAPEAIVVEFEEADQLKLQTSTNTVKPQEQNW